MDAVFEESGDTLLYHLADESQPAPDAEVLQASDRAQLERALVGLDDRERHILCHYFGLEGKDPLKLEQVGRQLGLTRERVRQIKEKALLKLHRTLRQYRADQEGA